MARVFLMTLVAGFLGVLAMCRMSEVAWRFVRLIAVLALTFAALVLAMYVAEGGWRDGGWANGATAAGGLAILAAYGVLALAPVAKDFERVVRGLAAGGALAGMVAAGCWGVHQGLWPLDHRLALVAALAGQALSAVLLGSVSLAMLLGHAYLTHTAMTIHPLRRLARIFMAAMAGRLAWVVLVTGGFIAWELSRGRLSTQELWVQTLMLSVRGLVGLLIPTIFAWMVVQTVKLRATQSATGILYFTLVLVYIGELAAQYLVRELGLPF